MSRDRALHAVRTALADRAYRITKPRMSIVREFAAVGRYVTAKELHARLARKHSGIGLATIYRTLEALQDVGSASARPQPRGETGFLFCPAGHHHHAVCTSCGRVEDVPCKSVGKIARDLTSGLRFTMTQHQVEFLGLCERCS